ncbi:hypothetical protein [Streptomyces acidiscabies]|nr:hypothetical protein [Streptomyces acidiscabies]
MRLPELLGYGENAGFLTVEMKPQCLPYDVLHCPPRGVGEVFKGLVEVRG